MDLGELGNRIRKRREQRRLRQADIASALQISAQAVSKWERGENAPDIAVLVDLATLLDVTIEWLLGGTSGQRETFPAVVFATSVQGYAERSGQLSPRQLAAWANSIHYSVTEAVRQHDGVPVKYVGDGFLGFFVGVNRAERALAAARTAHRLVDHGGLAIALHCGEIFLGQIGHPEYASPDILGAAVNTVFLMMPHVLERCPTRIGMTDTVAAAIEGGTVPRACGEITIPGLSEPLRLFEPGD
ncbi:MAG: helix-turn-helix domain-containing protein [Proteobacteria bacterium]|nr:helix-turn-helix domain-containing protein [Pseudomonadota bacterium]